MSFNIRVDVASDGEDAWPHRVEAVAATIREADVVGVQEATAAMLDTLDARLSAYTRFGLGRDADGGGEQSALLFRTDRFERLGGGTFWLSPTPDAPGSVGWDAALPRIATWARFRDRTTGAAFVVVNTHFDHRGATARRASARLVADRALAIADGDPLVVTGDLNAPDGSDVVQTFAAALRDARLVSESPPAGGNATWNGFGRDADGGRIDYVFVSEGVRVRVAATLDRTIGEILGTDNPRLPSDHHAVTATLAF
ncbi:endonuclease/exonuclease/phosphatase family protein [Rubrivirga sp. IMCC43871]|uniref:endonuclease/exonuclease/phosphatase family protein n=1 Tax=Rubrivirga sp. IMCC43871 TaxID=3391575 RepID=UPI00398FB68F